jgi:hypothetical protein
LNGWAYNLSTFPPPHIVRKVTQEPELQSQEDDNELDKKPSSITTEFQLEYDYRKWNKLKALTFTYVEDDRDAHPFVFYNENTSTTNKKDKVFEDFAFWLVDG